MAGKKYTTERILTVVLAYGLLSAFAVIYLFPFIRSIFTSVMEWSQARVYPPAWVPDPFTLEHFERVVFGLDWFWQWVGNSVLYSGIVVAGNLIFATMAGYAFARMEFPGRDVLFSALLALMMIPGFVMLVPNFIIMTNLNLVDSIFGLGIIGLVGVSNIFLMRQYFTTFPTDIFEAARLDGCTNIQSFLYIAFPLAKPALGAVAVYTFLGSWNAFLGPLVFLRSVENFTLTVGLNFAFSTQWYVEYGPIIAGTLITALPTIALFIALNKYLIKGIVITGGKG
jgi:multiple sugar transport system permease protein